ncbi:MAG: hypothetical protein M1815_005701 [Lichina confinis]|nr:MAG: hypothetical protein M1815_005701 [Lichina confinis]
MADIPSYVFEYAPKIWLHSEDPYRPSDIHTFVQRTRPQINFALLEGVPQPLDLNNLDALNGFGLDEGRDIYLTSVDDIAQDPEWIKGATPDASGVIDGQITGAVVFHDRGGGMTDAFYFYFWAEHMAIRFRNGQPDSLWYSQHATGQAFTYRAAEKEGKRPIGYCSNGSHAIYATTGRHDHTIPNFNLPFGPLLDYCDRGILWDPLPSSYRYVYDGGQFRPADGTTHPTAYLRFNGRWGDKQYRDSDPRQRKVLGIGPTAKYGGGPTGPRNKQLDRRNICPDNVSPCWVRPFLTP